MKSVWDIRTFGGINILSVRPFYNTIFQHQTSALKAIYFPVREKLDHLYTMDVELFFLCLIHPRRY